MSKKHRSYILIQIIFPPILKYDDDIAFRFFELIKNFVFQT